MAAKTKTITARELRALLALPGVTAGRFVSLSVGEAVVDLVTPRGPRTMRVVDDGGRRRPAARR
ncbi:MAG: hypothetical protein JW895_01975 [Thermoleophilaceae bacterium]|nr:hypothetical protein [Thermoleophilaceae bacterium]